MLYLFLSFTHFAVVVILFLWRLHNYWNDTHITNVQQFHWLAYESGSQTARITYHKIVIKHVK
jgi:hypothetical protein